MLLSPEAILASVSSAHHSFPTPNPDAILTFDQTEAASSSLLSVLRSTAARQRFKSSGIGAGCGKALSSTTRK